MPHFLIKNEEIKNNLIILKEKDTYFHLVKVLRIKIGEVVKFIDKNKIIYQTKIKEINKSELIAEVISKNISSRYLKNNICLIQSILMNDAQNSAIANATQTGVKEIYPVISDNVSVSVASLKNKIEKWQKIAYENFKQCERADIPKINEISDLISTIKNFKKENVLIFAEKYENIAIKKSLESIDKNEKIAIVIGPEGGFSQKEFNYFIENKYKLITLGKMIFKAPNAIVSAISNIVTRLEEDV